MRQIDQFETSNAWAVGRFDAIPSAGHLPKRDSGAYARNPVVLGGRHINGGVSGVFKAETRDEESAKNIRDIMSGFIALAKMQAGSHPSCDHGRNLQLSGEGKNIAVSFTVPSELFDALQQLKQLEQAR